MKPKPSKGSIPLWVTLGCLTASSSTCSSFIPMNEYHGFGVVVDVEVILVTDVTVVDVTVVLVVIVVPVLLVVVLLTLVEVSEEVDDVIVNVDVFVAVVDGVTVEVELVLVVVGGGGAVVQPAWIVGHTEQWAHFSSTHAYANEHEIGASEYSSLAAIWMCSLQVPLFPSSSHIVKHPFEPVVVAPGVVVEPHAGFQWNFAWQPEALTEQ